MILNTHKSGNIFLLITLCLVLSSCNKGADTNPKSSEIKNNQNKNDSIQQKLKLVLPEEGFGFTDERAINAYDQFKGKDFFSLTKKERHKLLLAIFESSSEYWSRNNEAILNFAKFIVTLGRDMAKSESKLDVEKIKIIEPEREESLHHLIGTGFYQNRPKLDVLAIAHLASVLVQVKNPKFILRIAKEAAKHTNVLNVATARTLSSAIYDAKKNIEFGKSNLEKLTRYQKTISDPTPLELYSHKDWFGLEEKYGNIKSAKNEEEVLKHWSILMQTYKNSDTEPMQKLAIRSFVRFINNDLGTALVNHKFRILDSQKELWNDVKSKILKLEATVEIIKEIEKPIPPHKDMVISEKPKIILEPEHKVVALTVATVFGESPQYYDSADTGNSFGTLPLGTIAHVFENKNNHYLMAYTNTKFDIDWDTGKYVTTYTPRNWLGWVPVDALLVRETPLMLEMLKTDTSDLGKQINKIIAVNKVYQKLPVRVLSASSEEVAVFSSPGIKMKGKTIHLLLPNQIYFVYKAVEKEGQWYFLLGHTASLKKRDQRGDARGLKTNLLGWVKSDQISLYSEMDVDKVYVSASELKYIISLYSAIKNTVDLSKLGKEGWQVTLLGKITKKFFINTAKYDHEKVTKILMKLESLKEVVDYLIENQVITFVPPLNAKIFESPFESQKDDIDQINIGLKEVNEAIEKFETIYRNEEKAVVKSKTRRSHTFEHLYRIYWIDKKLFP